MSAFSPDVLTEGELYGVVLAFVGSDEVNDALETWSQVVRTGLEAHGFEFVRPMGEGVSMEDGVCKRLRRQLWRDPALDASMVVETDMAAYMAPTSFGQTYLSAKLTGTLADLTDPRAPFVQESQYLTAPCRVGGQADAALAQLHRGLADVLEALPLPNRQRTVQAFLQDVLQRQCH